MTISRRGTSWQATVHHKGTRYRRQFTSEVEARAWEAESTAALLRGNAPDMGEGSTLRRKPGLPHTLQELADYTQANVWAHKKGSHKTVFNARDVARRLGPAKPITKLTRGDFDKLVADLLRAGNSNATVNRKLSALSRMLTTALDLGIIAAKPRLPEHLPEVEWKHFRITPELEARLLNALRATCDDEVFGWAVLALDTGARLNEVLRLGSDDVDGDAITLRNRKSGRTTVMPLTTRARAVVGMLTRRAAAAGRTKLFEDLTVARLRRLWATAARALSLSDEARFTPHILRHEFCCRLVERGVDIKTVMHLADHSNLATTQRYLGLYAPQAMLTAAIAKLEIHPPPHVAITTHHRH